jgi:hypothetical protein
VFFVLHGPDLAGLRESPRATGSKCNELSQAASGSSSSPGVGGGGPCFGKDINMLVPATPCYEEAVHPGYLGHYCIHDCLYNCQCVDDSKSAFCITCNNMVRNDVSLLIFADRHHRNRSSSVTPSPLHGTTLYVHHQLVWATQSATA